MKNLLVARAAFFIACFVASFVPALAKNDINFAFQQNPSSAQLNGIQRNEDLGVGTFWYDFFGTVPKFANLAVTPSAGLYVQVAPALTNTLGAVYVPMADDTSVFGTGAVALAADPTLITRQGLLSSPPISLPVPAPSGANTSIAYLAECSVARADANPFQYNFINNANQLTQGTIYHDRLDTVTCMAKASTPASIPTVPAPDTNYVGVASIVVPNGATGTTTGMITMQPSNVIGNSLQAYNGANVNQAGCFVPGGGTVSMFCYNSLTDNGNATINGSINVGGGESIASALNVSGSIYSSTGISSAGPLTVGSTSLNASGITVASGGNISVGSGSLTGNAFYVPGTVSGTSGFFTAINSLTIGSSTGNGTINVPGNGSLYTNYFSGAGGILFCNGSQACPASVSAGGNINAVQGNFTSGLVASTGTFTNAVTAYSTTTGAQVGVGTGFGAVPGINNASDGGMNLSISPNSTLGYRFFSATSPLTQLLSIDMGGNVNATSFTAGPNYMNSSNFYASLGYLAGNGIFNSSNATAYLCGANGAYCATVTNGRANGGDVSIPGGFVGGTYGTDYAAVFNFGGSHGGVTEIGSSSTSQISGVAGEILRVADCKTVSGQAACSSDARTFLSINNSGQLGVNAGVFAGGPYTQASARSLKRDIHPVTDDPLSVIDSVKPVRYNYKTESGITPAHYGLIADDTNSDISGLKKKTYDPGALAVFDAAAIKEVRAQDNARIARLEHEVAALLRKR